MFTDITNHDGLPWVQDYYTLHMKCPHCLMLWRLGSHRGKKFCKCRMQLEIINHDGSSPRESCSRCLLILFSTLCGPRRGVSATHSSLQIVLPKYMDPIDHDPLKPWAKQSSSFCCWRRTLCLLQRVTNTALVEEEGPVWEVAGDSASSALMHLVHNLILHLLSIVYQICWFGW